MKHKASLGFFEYWNRQRGDQRAPLRRTIEPADIRTFLPNVFILERQHNCRLAFRLAGTAICNMLGREVKGTALADLWLPEQAGSALTLAASVLSDVKPAVIDLIGESRGGRSTPLELLLLPVASTPSSVDRIFGTLTAPERPYWMDLDPVIGCVTAALRLPDPAKDQIFREDRAETSAPIAAAVRNLDRAEHLKRLRHLTLLDGGRRD